jgi:hypothetical protein
MGIRDEIAAITRQTQALGQIREEIETEGAEFWERLDLLSDREQWEADQQATAEYEQWYLDKLAMEADAENLGLC